MRRRSETALAPRRRDTPLLAAVRYGIEAAMELLLSRRDVDGDFENRTGWTALSMAGQKGLVGIVEMIKRVSVGAHQRSLGLIGDGY
ncbi:hypothetical protein L873DRAFT_1879601 [Choiromyces venosus 120613-1]|uniref:Uncharacterized protein n=1 Tax=Choiromyces venosus 120613-1 TaxID=1336337 RepID=A0A3N4J141_9PEZI|nr:hypothetical protein L873DRAFT_1879601 [Choiromyces venosus 120613-1]